MPRFIIAPRIRGVDQVADTQAPSTPTNLVATTVDSTRIDVSWGMSTDTGGSGLAGYQLEWSATGTGGWTLLIQQTTRTYSHTGLSASTAYFYRVQAYDGVPNYSGYSSVATATTSSTGSDPTQLPRLQAADIAYQGSFQLSLGGANSGFDNGGAGMSVSGSTLYLAGNLQGQTLGRITIPNAPFTGQMASVISQPVAVAGSAGGTGGSQYQTGTLVYNGRLIVQKAASYDANNDSTNVFTSGSLTVSGFTAMQRTVITGSGFYRYYNGCMTHIPSEWQSLFGGPALCGNGTQSNDASASWGPACGVFNPDNVTSGGANVPVRSVIHYTISNPITNVRTANELYSAANQFLGGMAFPSGRRTIMFVGRHGYGPWDYKGPNDPCDQSQAGEQAYPYRLQAWLYDANECLDAMNGVRQPYSVQPYLTLNLTPPNMSQCIFTFMGMATYDPVTRRLYVTERDGWPANLRIHVWTVAA